jgi:hypothetical protein
MTIYETHYDIGEPIDASSHTGPWCDDCGAPVVLWQHADGGAIVVDATRRWHVCPNQARVHFGNPRYNRDGSYRADVPVLCGLKGFRETTLDAAHVDCKRCLRAMARNRRIEERQLARRDALKGDNATVYYRGRTFPGARARLAAVASPKQPRRARRNAFAGERLPGTGWLPGGELPHDPARCAQCAEDEYR